MYNPEMGWKHWGNRAFKNRAASAVLIALFISLLGNLAVIYGWTLRDSAYLPKFAYLQALSIATMPLRILRVILDSGFFIALLGALCGSISAFLFQRRAKRFDDKEQEIKFANQAVISAGGIANTALNFKKQHVLELVTGYAEEVDAFNSFEETKRAGALRPGEQYILTADYRNLATFHSPIEILLKACEHTAPNGLVLMKAYTIKQCIEQLNELISERRELIRETHEPKNQAVGKRMAMYFGFQYEGNHDERNKTIIEGIGKSTDDIIFFSIKVCQEFTVHAKKLRGDDERYSTVRSMQFDAPVENGLAPSDENYQDWAPERHGGAPK